MKRLTEWGNGSLCYSKYLDPNDKRGYGYAAMERLAAYEDTGLEPEDIVTLQHSYEMIGKMFDIPAAIMPEKLCAIIEAELDGRLVVLPPPAKYGEPKPECFYNDCAGIWCLGYAHNGDDEPIDRCKRCWYCADGDYADGSVEAEAALKGGEGHE